MNGRFLWVLPEEVGVVTRVWIWTDPSFHEDTPAGVAWEYHEIGEIGKVGDGRGFQGYGG